MGDGGLGTADDCFAFTIDEVDGEDYFMEKDELGGYQVKPRTGGASSSTGMKGKEKGKAKAKAEKQPVAEKEEAADVSADEEVRHQGF